MTRKDKTVGIIVLLIIIALPSFSTFENSSIYEEVSTISDQAYDSSTITNMIDADFFETECSSVIVTGSAAKDGRAILMKNRDYILDPNNMPFYVAATIKTYAYVTINYNTMGINEKGLAVMNTAMPILEPDPAEGNLELNRLILEYFESVDDVAKGLNDTHSIIGPDYRSDVGTIATCVGIVDRFGEGAFFEISNTEAYVQYVIDGYDTRANHPRIFPGLASGPNGRDQYLLDILDEVYIEKGVISWEDVMQNASRFVHHREIDQSSFTIDGEVCNPNTVAAMVAVSGDPRYDGKLNCMWASCGLTPILGVFVPSMAFASNIPNCASSLHSYCLEKYQSAQLGSNPILLNSSRVREVQDYAFFAEDFTINEYDKLLHSIPEDLTDVQLETYLYEFVDKMCNYAADVFIGETKEIVMPSSVTFSSPTSSSTTSSSSSTFPTDSDSGNSSYDLSSLMVMAIGLIAGITIVVLVALVKWREV